MFRSDVVFIVFLIGMHHVLHSLTSLKWYCASYDVACSYHIESYLIIKYQIISYYMPEIGILSQQISRSTYACNHHVSSYYCILFISQRPGFWTKCIMSGQIIMLHQPGFSWNKGISLTKPPFGENRSCEVAIIWPDFFRSYKGDSKLAFFVSFRHSLVFPASR